MTEERFREEAERLIVEVDARIWLTRVRGHRLDFLCSAGGEQLTPIEKLARRGDYILLGQQVPDEFRAKLQHMLDVFAMAQSVDGEAVAPG